MQYQIGHPHHQHMRVIAERNAFLCKYGSQLRVSTMSFWADKTFENFIGPINLFINNSATQHNRQTMRASSVPWHMFFKSMSINLSFSMKLPIK